MIQYVNPKLCAHRVISVLQKDNFMIARCDVCQLSGRPVKVGRFVWWAKSRATRQFYKTAFKVD